ncbi:MAG: hypothetical protein K9N47_01595 [Prosthecobacter sp.]|uniref:hypothetical protein n=1 Tax=Prosthecobacter sp. TaxID=1965333 RepID=UPI0025CD6F23|nr:hypothetical protein [Prosthecobacter sp.]MCF7784781.1 hypothetical protein [Prosthecobacter sp.]
MKPSARDVWRFIECVGLGLWFALMTPELAGGIYEVITGSPSDGFLFMLMIFVVPWFAAVMAIVPAACWRVRKFLLMTRWTAFFYLIVLIGIWCLQP